MSNIEISPEAREAAIQIADDIAFRPPMPVEFNVGQCAEIIQLLLNTVRAADAEAIEQSDIKIQTLQDQVAYTTTACDSLREQLAQAIRERDEAIREAKKLLSGL